mmetsp:Transcript_5823/g.8094  ORF Transcript_5823/g.8094 Transcript_5823/m.8094 type:complete len:263 (-) Transcript_5823:75-863(-)
MRLLYLATCPRIVCLRFERDTSNASADLDLLRTLSEPSLAPKISCSTQEDDAGLSFSSMQYTFTRPPTCPEAIMTKPALNRDLQRLKELSLLFGFTATLFSAISAETHNLSNLAARCCVSFAVAGALAALLLACGFFFSASFFTSGGDPILFEMPVDFLASVAAELAAKLTSTAPSGVTGKTEPTAPTATSPLVSFFVVEAAAEAGIRAGLEGLSRSTTAGWLSWFTYRLFRGFEGDPGDPLRLLLEAIMPPSSMSPVEWRR